MQFQTITIQITLNDEQEATMTGLSGDAEMVAIDKLSEQIDVLMESALEDIQNGLTSAGFIVDIRL